jgi:hypothetical protein
MKKNETLLEARNRYILDKINNSDSIVKVVHEISSELFISERTIYRVIKTTDTITEDMNTRSNKKLDKRL